MYPNHLLWVMKYLVQFNSSSHFSFHNINNKNSFEIYFSIWFNIWYMLKNTTFLLSPLPIYTFATTEFVS